MHHCPVIVLVYLCVCLIVMTDNLCDIASDNVVVNACVERLTVFGVIRLMTFI